MTTRCVQRLSTSSIPELTYLLSPPLLPSSWIWAYHLLFPPQMCISSSGSPQATPTVPFAFEDLSFVGPSSLGHLCNGAQGLEGVLPASPWRAGAEKEPGRGWGHPLMNKCWHGRMVKGCLLSVQKNLMFSAHNKESAILKQINVSSVYVECNWNNFLNGVWKESGWEDNREMNVTNSSPQTGKGI